jgi:hypothetical protein
VLNSRGASARASIACSVPFSIAQIVLPSVLTVSGSSTPASCTLVCDVSSPPPASLSGAGAAVGISGRAGIGPGSNVRGGGGGTCRVA